MPKAMCRLWIIALVVPGCGTREPKPIDIFPEDNCSYCRMAVSDQRFASEIIDTGGEAFKFDDIGCMLDFLKEKPEVQAQARFVKDVETRQWIPYEKAVIIDSDLQTPMGSGKIAFADAERAREFQKRIRERNR